MSGAPVPLPEPYQTGTCQLPTCGKAFRDHRFETVSSRYLLYFDPKGPDDSPPDPLRVYPHGAVDLDPGSDRPLTREEARERVWKEIEARKQARLAQSATTRALAPEGAP